MKVVNSCVLKEWYDSEYSACDNGTLFGELRGEFKQFLDSLPDGPGQALELGCGDGRNLTALARKGYSLSGVDMVDSTVQSRKHNPWLRELNFQQTDILNYVPAHESYDVLVCSEVLHFFTPRRTPTGHSENHQRGETRRLYISRSSLRPDPLFPEKWRALYLGQGSRIIHSGERRFLRCLARRLRYLFIQ